MWILVQYIYAESDPKHKLSFIDNVTSVHKRNIEKYTNQRTPKTDYLTNVSYCHKPILEFPKRTIANERPCQYQWVMDLSNYIMISEKMLYSVLLHDT